MPPPTCPKRALQVAGHFTTCSITVLEQRDGPQFIFGLDMLKRHLCVLDMAQGELRFGSCDATLQFLPEHQIPKDFKRHIEEVSQQQAEKNVDEAARAESAGGAGPSAGGDAAPMPMDAAPTPPAAATAVTTPAAMPPPAAAPAAAAAAPAAAPAVATPAAVSEAAVAQLVGLGFLQDIAVGALQATGGDVDAAASMLFGM